jgi:predicted nucleic acid-binding protein
VAPGNDHELHLLERAAAGDPVAITAPTVMEISHGLAKAAAHDDAFRPARAWFTRLITGDLIAVHHLDRHGALVAGRLRAAHPLPPTSGPARKATKPDQRAAWVLDIQIAACAWSAGAWLRTDNRHDFEVLSGLLSELYPETSPLRVEGAPDVPPG